MGFLEKLTNFSNKMDGFSNKMVEKSDWHSRMSDIASGRGEPATEDEIERLLENSFYRKIYRRHLKNIGAEELREK